MANRLLVAPLIVVALGLTISGCSIPAWVPLIGSEKTSSDGATNGAVEPPQPAAKTPPKPSEPPATSAIAKAEPLPDSSEVMDRVVCVVDNDAITLYELEEVEAHYLYESKEKPPEGEARNALRKKLLDRIIDTRIQLQLAEREKIIVDEAEITEQLDEIKKKLGAKTPAEFEEMLKSQSLTLEGVKKRIKDQLMVQRLTRRKVGLRVSVTEQEIDRYLEDNRVKLETGLSFEAKHMLFLPKPPDNEDGWEAARRKSEEVYSLLLAGQDFGELAKKYSEDASGKDGGGLGSLKRGELAPDIEEAILKLSPGQFSSPFRSKVGYHLFYLDSKETLTGEALVQARNQIRDILYRQKYDARMQEWVAEIRQKAVIDIRM
ncbi:MAG TPA: peptidylprolyl isomerase [Candidatus Methylomirabilis sp.]|nr:peptidylprolyl isomerase [Candidatus Methylomirabilis sp.]